MPERFCCPATAQEDKLLNQAFDLAYAISDAAKHTVADKFMPNKDKKEFFDRVHEQRGKCQEPAAKQLASLLAFGGRYKSGN